MRRSSSKPHQLREQLLQAIDAQNNIRNMAAVLDVIYCLENYPMTKEVLMETRLGKLINDVRKRSRDEDLVKRLKTLVRSWQRLAGVSEAREKELLCPTVKSNLTRAECVSRSTQTFSTSVHSNMNQRCKMSDASSSAKTMNYLTNIRQSKIPIRAIKPYSSSHMPIKQSSASSHLSASLSNHNPQDNEDIVRYLHKSQRPASRCSTMNLLMAEEPALSTSSASCVPSNSFIQDSHTKTEQPADPIYSHNNILTPASEKVNLLSHNEASNKVKDLTIATFENKTVNNQHGSFMDKDNGHITEDNNRPAQMKESKLIYDHHTQQIKPMSYKTSYPHEDSQRLIEFKAQGSEKLGNSSELSQSETIKPDQNLQNGSETSGSSLCVAENIMQGKDEVKEDRKTKLFIPDLSVTEFPGVSRELTEKDLHRIHHQRWHGVNGCYDNRFNWFDWTQSITLDSYGDGKTLKISPYVCIDYFRF